MAISTKKNKKVKGKKTTFGNPEGTHLTVKGPDTYESNLRGGALDEFVAPKVAQAKGVLPKIGAFLQGASGNLFSKQGAAAVGIGSLPVAGSYYGFFD